MSDAVRLNLGAGPNPLPDYVNLDIKTGTDIGDLSKYADGSVSEVRASHVLEHVAENRLMSIFREWHRALKPGGEVRIAVPDFDHIVKTYRCEVIQSYHVETVLMGGQTDEHDLHRTIWTRKKLVTWLRSAGFVRVEGWDSDDPDTSQHPGSLCLKARKIEDQPQPVIRFVMTAPRLGFTSSWVSFASTIAQFPRAKLIVTGGAFWGQGITSGLEQALEEGATHIVTLDYDSAITADDVRELFYLAASFPEYGAFVPLQAARHWDRPLMYRLGTDGKPQADYSRAVLAEPVMEIDSGHFGCTLIKADALRSLPRPWFYGRPDAAGRWSDAKTDDDIAFWQKWRAEGHRIALANRVHIGHLEMMVKWLDGNLRTIHQGLGDYEKNGAPKEAWK